MTQKEIIHQAFKSFLENWESNFPTAMNGKLKIIPFPTIDVKQKVIVVRALAFFEKGKGQKNKEKPVIDLVEINILEQSINILNYQKGIDENSSLNCFKDNNIQSWIFDVLKDLNELLIQLSINKERSLYEHFRVDFIISFNEIYGRRNRKIQFYDESKSRYIESFIRENYKYNKKTRSFYINIK